MHEPKNQANQSPSCVLCGAELASRDADRGTCHTCRDPSGKLLDLHVAILAALDDPMRIQEWPKIESRLRDRFGRGLDTAELWRQALGWIEDRLALAPNVYLRMPIAEFYERLTDDSLFIPQTSVQTSQETVDNNETQRAIIGKESRSRGKKPSGDSKTDVPVSRLHKPSEKAWTAWQLCRFVGVRTQAEVADMMTEEGMKTSQGSVSRYIKQVDAFIARSNVLPDGIDLGKPKRPEFVTMDPERLELGERQDSRTARQRPRRDPDSAAD